MSLVSENRRLNTEEVREGKTRLASTPLQVNVELTGICNINPPCLFCSGKNFGHDYRPLDPAYLDKYAHLLDRCEHVNEDSFGEPLSHPALVDVARRFTENGQVFSLVTNGLLLNRDVAERLAACGPRLGMHVSFNAATEETFFKLTGKSFARVVDNVHYFVRTYREQNESALPDLILTFIVMKINRHEVMDFLRLTREVGARALLASLHDRPSVPLGHFGYDFVYEEEMLPYADLLRIGEEATALAGEIGLVCLLQWDAARDSAVRGFAEPGVATPCLIPWRFLFIQEHTQKVFACPYHRIPYGDLAEAPVDEIWNGETAQDLRRSLASGEIPKFCCDHGAGCPLLLAAGPRGSDEEKIEDHIDMGTNDFVHLAAGWYPLERIPDPVRWTAQSAEILLRTAGRRRFLMEAAVWGEHAATQPIRGRVEMAGQELGGFDLCSNGWNVFSFPLPDALASPVSRGRIVTERTWVPAEQGLGADTRRLGIAVRRIWVE